MAIIIIIILRQNFTTTHTHTRLTALCPGLRHTPPLSFLQAGCPSCCPTKSVKALKATSTEGKSYDNTMTNLQNILRQMLRQILQSNLHIAPDRKPRQHPTTQFFTGRMPFLPPNQQC